MTSVRDRVWWTLATRPILGLLIRERRLEAPPFSRPYTRPNHPSKYLVKNPRTNLYWRNPWPHYQVGTPEWGKAEQAYRFHCPDYARSIMSEQGVTGEVIAVQTPR